MHKKEKEKYSEQEDVVVNEALVHFFLFVFALVRLYICAFPYRESPYL